jgi:exopolysaccharide/PEP-CTERM locus tyrosine autokinase
MSIVERALQKAQARAKTGAAVSAPVSPGDTAGGFEEARSSADETAEGAMPLATGLSEPSSGAAESDMLSATSRDLKSIVQIDFDRLRSVGRLPGIGMMDQTADEIRRIKWPLLKAISGSEPEDSARNNVILVTSALPGEGKTFTALNLALSIVRDREQRVVLVDGDVARPGLTPALGLEGRPGLNDVLEDVSKDISEVTYMTDVEGLFFVPAGKWHAHAPEFFAGSRMPTLISSLGQRVRNGVVIIDSPPLLATNEAQVASRVAGQILLVVRSDDTPQEAVMDALALIDKSVPVRAVLNRVQPSVLNRYYGQYYYGQGTGYGYGREGGRT